MMLDAARVAVLLTAASLPFSTAGTNIFMLSAVLFWALAAQWRSTAQAIAAEPAAWLGWALFAALVLGTSWSHAPAGDALDTALKYRELALFGIVMFLFADARWRLRLLWVLFGAALALLAGSYAVHFGLIDIEPQRKLSQGAVLLKSSITHSLIMSLLACGAAIMSFQLRGWHRWAMLLVAVLAAANVLIAIQGRTGYLVLAALLLWLALRRWSVNGIVAASLALGIATAAAYQLAPTFQARIDKTGAEARRWGGDPTNNSLGQRLHYWKRSAELAARHGLVGVGTGGWREAFYAATANDHPFFHDRAHKHPHNEYLFITVQLGIGGLVMFVALFVVAFWRAGLRPEPEGTLARAVVIAFAIGCLVNDFLFDSTEGHVWAVLGGALFGAPPLSAARPGAPEGHHRASAS
ncbi:MAG TPA: O-antigen ligase family protein [Burkholderiales bacterium]